MTDAQIRERIAWEELLRVERDEIAQRRLFSIEDQLVGYAVSLSWSRCRLGLAMERLNRIVEIHDRAKAEGNYALSDEIRKALDIEPYETTIITESHKKYEGRFDVPTKKKYGIIRFIATPNGGRYD